MVVSTSNLRGAHHVTHFLGQ